MLFKDTKIGSFGFAAEKEPQDQTAKQKKKNVTKFKKPSNPLSKKRWLLHK